MGKFPHIIRAQQWDRQSLDSLFQATRDMERVFAAGGNSSLSDVSMFTLFYEPSTRTRLSFEIAMKNLGGRVLGTENAAEFSSAIKGETVEDTVRVLAGYTPRPVIVLRHKESGASERAAALDVAPIINAGDGPGQHPTQALIDVYTIWKELETIDGLRIALVGDLAHGRAVRSLAYILAKFKIECLYLVSPSIVRMQQDVKDYLERHGIRFEETSSLGDVAKRVDVVYQTRIQKERFGDRTSEYEAAYGQCIIDENIVSLMPSRSILLHPLPRVNEITLSVDADPRAAYFRQAHNGVPLRMTLLNLIFSNNLHLQP